MPRSASASSPAHKTAADRGQAGRAPGVTVVEYDRYVDEQIRKTARAVRAIDISRSVLRLVVVGVLALLAVAVVEHWVAPGGLGATGRYAVFAVGLAGVSGWLTVDLWPLLLRKINPVYAARTIEQASPLLKNSLVNLLLFRAHRREMPAAVYEAVERQAAERLAGAPPEESIDGRGVIRWGYVLVAALAVGAVYALVSPKNPFTTAARVLMPWASISAPTRVQVTGVTPGNASAARGEAVVVQAAVTGLETDEQPTLVIATPGGESDLRLPMTEAEGIDQFATAWLPTASSGEAEQTLRYHIQAGDARSPVFRLTLLTKPAIAVRSIRYDYPDYTGYVDRTAEGIGDVRAIEGTRVTLFAEANLPIASAQVDLQGDGRPDQSMAVDGARAQAAFELALRDDRRTPRHASYVLRFTSTDDRANTDPASYRIEVLPDLPPEATILAPTEPVREVRLDETVVLRVEARDPDFALDSVRVLGESLGDPVFDERLLSERLEGRFEGQWRFTPAEHNLTVGDVVDYWFEASDVRRPEPLKGATRRQKLKVVAAKNGASDADDPNGQRQRGGDQGGQRGGEGQPGETGDAPPDGQQRGDDDSAGGRGAPEGSPEAGAEGGGQQSGGDQQGGENQAGGQQENANQGGEEGQQQGAEGGAASNDPAAQGGGESQSAGGLSGQPPSEGGGADNGGGDEMQSAPGNGSNNQQGAADRPVSAEGDDDAAAIERMREHFNRQRDAPQDSQQRGGQQQSGQQQGDQQQSGRQQDQQQPSQPRESEAGDPLGDPGAQRQPGEGGAGASDGRSDPPSSGGAEPAADQPQREPGGDAGERSSDPGNDRKQSDSSANGESGAELGNEDSAENSRAPREGTGGEGKNQAADQGGGESGDSGAGQDSGRAGDQRAGGSQQGNPGGGQRGKGQNQRTGAGDQPGGAEDGNPGGNKSPRQQNGEGGANDAGSSQGGADEPGAADQQGNGDGAGRGGDRGPSERAGNQNPNMEKGAGENTGDAQPNSQQGEPKGQPGERQDNSDSRGGDPSDRQSGEPAQGNEPRDNPRQGEQPGGDSKAGSQPQPGGEGQQPGATQPEQRQPAQRQPAQRQPEQRQPEQRQPEQRQPAQRQPSRPGSTPAGGTPNDRGGGGGEGEHRGGEPGGDAASLDYAREQTDLVLEQLADQLAKKDVDRELLDKLGWSEADLRRFVDRWQSRKQAAQQRGEGGQRELDAALRSLGLKPPSLSGRTNTKQDGLRDLRSGRRSTVPAKFRNRLKRYNEGVSRED
ncbi:MAG: hypothetical protein AAGB00_08175 [Planctomycetota bacterium]